MQKKKTSANKSIFLDELLFFTGGDSEIPGLGLSFQPSSRETDV